MRIARFVCWLALLAGLMVYRLDSAAAQGSDAARQACTPDALKLCSDVIPDVAKVTACMKAKRAQLSEACRVAMSGGGGGEDKHEGKHYAKHHGKRYYHHARHCSHHHCT
jgi:hypothetical protein